MYPSFDKTITRAIALVSADDNDAIMHAIAEGSGAAATNGATAGLLLHNAVAAAADATNLTESHLVRTALRQEGYDEGWSNEEGIDITEVIENIDITAKKLSGILTKNWRNILPLLRAAERLEPQNIEVTRADFLNAVASAQRIDVARERARAAIQQHLEETGEAESVATAVDIMEKIIIDRCRGYVSLAECRALRTIATDAMLGLVTLPLCDKNGKYSHRDAERLVSHWDRISTEQPN